MDTAVKVQIYKNLVLPFCAFIVLLPVIHSIYSPELYVRSDNSFYDGVPTLVGCYDSYNKPHDDISSQMEGLFSFTLDEKKGFCNYNYLPIDYAIKHKSYVLYFLYKYGFVVSLLLAFTLYKFLKLESYLKSRIKQVFKW